MASSPRHQLAQAAMIAAACATLVGCPGRGYIIPGDLERDESTPILEASDPAAHQSRAAAPPGVEVAVLCAPGPIIRTGFARDTLAPHPSGGDGLFLLVGDALSESREGFEVPVRADAADALPLSKGDWIELRAVGRARIPTGYWPNRMQICRWLPDRALVGTLWRPGDAGPDVAYEFRTPIPATGLRSSGTVAVHRREPTTGWWRIRITTRRGRTLRLRYAPIGGRPLALRRGQELTIQALPPDPVASLRGLAVILHTPQDGLIAAINTGASLTSEYLDGVEVTPSGRLIYSDVRQLPSLCVARIEHQSLRLRSGEGVQYATPGTFTRFVHRGKRYRLVAHDAALRALADPCGDETRQRLSYTITLEGTVAEPEDEVQAP